MTSRKRGTQHKKKKPQVGATPQIGVPPPGRGITLMGDPSGRVVINYLGPKDTAAVNVARDDLRIVDLGFVADHVVSVEGEVSGLSMERVKQTPQRRD